MKNINPNKTFWLLLFVAALFAGSFSLCVGLQQSVWFDEAYSISLAQHSWSDIVRLAAADVHPPMYYWILKAWGAVFGFSELALRSMSALFLGMSIGIAGLLLRKLFNTKVALIALPFFMLAPFLLRYGFEIRMYALCSFIGIAATYVLLMAVEENKKKRRWLLFALYSLLVALGVYTLYFMALIWIAHLSWLAWVIYKERRYKLIKPTAASYASAFILFIPWLPVFLSKAKGETLSPVTNRLDLENLYGMVTYLFLYTPPWDMKGFGVALVALVLFLLAYIAVRGFKNADSKDRKYLLLLAMYFFVPVLVLIVVTQVLPIYIERYVAHFAIGLFALIGVLAAFSLKKAGKLPYLGAGGLLMILFFGCISLTNFGNYNFQRVHTPSVREVAGLLASCKNDAVIFADGPQIAVELGYYITDCPIYFFNETLEMGGGFAMLSNSPLRVASASDLPIAKEVLHIYYDKPKQSLPNSFDLKSVITIEAVSIATYRDA